MSKEIYTLIMGKVSAVSGYTEDELIGKDRRRELCDARHTARHLLFINGVGKSEISRYFKCTHASVIHAIRTVDNLTQTSPKFKNYFENHYGEFLIKNTRKPVYIIGKVTGEPYNECFNKFLAREQQLLSAGWLPVNPMRIVPQTATWDEAMRICIAALVQSYAISLIPGWKGSEGAELEIQIASKLQMGQIS